MGPELVNIHVLIRHETIALKNSETLVWYNSTYYVKQKCG